MEMLNPANRRVHRLKSCAYVIGIGVSVLGLVVLIGWALNIPTLKSVFPGLATMKANTALGFLFAGISLWLATVESPQPWQRQTSQVSAGVVALIGLLSLCEYAFGWNLRIDNLLFRSAAQSSGLFPGRMASSTAANFLLSGLALLILDVRWRRQRPTEWLALIVGFISTLALMGYAYGIPSLYQMAPYASTALHTALAFCAVSIGILLARPETGLMRIFASTSLGGGLARRLLPAALLIPLILGWLRVKGEAEQLYGFGFGLALYTLTLTAVFVLLIWWNATSLDRTDSDRKRAEEALRESEERFQAMVNGIPQLAWMAEADGHIFWYNQRWYEYTGTTFEQMEGWGWQRVHDPGVLPDVLDRWRGAIAGGTPFDMEFPLRGADGSFRVFLTRVLPVKNSDGRVVRWLGTNTDISDRKQAEEALRESEERFQAMVNGIPQLAWMAEADGHIFWYNQRWYEYTGTTSEQMEGWGWQSVHDPGVLPEVLDRWRGAIAGGTPFDMEFPLRGADGNFRVFLTRVLPVKNSDGRVVRWLGTNTDISDRKQAEERLAQLAKELTQQAEELLRSRQALEAQTIMLQSVLDGMAEGLVAADPQGKFLIWNRAAEKIVGYGPAELEIQDWTAHYGQYLPDGVTPLPPEQNPLARAIRGEACTAQIFLRNPKVAEGVWIEASATPLRDTNGVVRGGVVAFRDITQRRTDEREIRQLNDKLEIRVAERTAELAEANKELEAFTYSVAHDLRAPLRHIQGFSKALMEDFGGGISPAAQEYVDDIVQGTQRMGQLVDDLLSLARIGRQELRIQVTALSSLVEEVLRDLKNEAQGREIRWQVGDLPFVDCDPGLMKQVFFNLLANAVKYTGPRKPAVIEVGQTTVEGRSVIFVRDNGVGFNMKYADKLFGVFQRLHRREDFEGTGVGLATVQRIIHKHGGRIWAEAEIDKGATFSFSFAVPDKDESQDRQAMLTGGKF